MKLKLSTQEKSDFRIQRAQFEGTLEFFADLNVAVAIPESESEQDTVAVAYCASKTPMSKTYAMWQVMDTSVSDCDHMVLVLRKDRTDSEICRDMAEVFSLVELSLGEKMVRDALSDSRLGDRWDDYIKKVQDRRSFDR